MTPIGFLLVMGIAVMYGMFLRMLYKCFAVSVNEAHVYQHGR
jgi:hypothetical protein